MNEEEKTVSASRLGKEAKIGVSVILGLLLIFVAAIVLRFSGYFAGDDAAVAAAPPAAESPEAEGGLNAPSLPPLKPAPTVLLANSDSGRPPQPIDHKPNRWKHSPPKSREANLPELVKPKPLSPPPSMPDPMSGMAIASPPSNAKQVGAGRPARGEIIERPPQNNPMRPERIDPNGYVPPGAPPPLPPYRDPDVREKFDLPPPPSHPDRSYSDPPSRPTPAAPISRYGGADSGYVPPDARYVPPGSGYVPPDARSAESDYRRPTPPSRYEDSPGRRGRGRSFDSPPPLSKDGKYEIQPLDSFWTISEKFFGTGAYFRALEEHNRDKIDDEGRLTPGDFVIVPTVEQLEKSYPDLCPKAERRETLQRRERNVSTNRNLHRGRTYKVNEGDTLFDIARYELGKAARWVEIYELNRDVLGKDFNYLTPGTVLVMPDDGRPDVLAEPPNSRYRR